MSSIKTRFAPSPTGFLHVGGVRTALYAWLLARQQGGEFLLRIEDTDKAREVAGSIEHIQETLQWLGIQWSGDVTKQSNRLDVYKQYAQKLVDAGRAYADPTTPEELTEMREAAKAAKKPFLFRDHRPENPPTWDGSMPLRFKSEPASGTWHDVVIGDVPFGDGAVDDFILMKSDGYPTYNFAHIVDDHEMGITHVIRGQEFIASVPNYLNLYAALGITPPVLATMPPILGKDGNKKLSKRDGAKDVLDYRADGILPEALLNFLASLGWNDGTEQEIFSVDELIAKFSLERVQKGGARFDVDRLIWMNGHHIRDLSVDDLYTKIDDHFWPEAAQNQEPEYKKAVLGLVQERLKMFSELPELTNFFFEAPSANDQAVMAAASSDRAQALLAATAARLQESDFTHDDLDTRLHQLLDEQQSKPGELFKLIRIVLTAASFSPPIVETMQVLGKERVIERLQQALAT